jgi:UDP-glucose 4-epimerase
VRYVVTAGAGFLGSALCTALADSGHDVVRADRDDRLRRLGDEGQHPRITTAVHELGVGSDLAPLLDGCDVLLHLAHRGLPSSPMAQIAQEAAANLGGGLELVEAARAAGVRRVVYASSGGTVYGRVSHVPVDETIECAPISAYGVGKSAMERYLQFFSADFGLSTVSLRVGNAVGEGQFRGAGVGAPAKFLAAAASGDPIHIWGDGTTVRDYVYVDDIVSAFVTASTADLPSGPYNVGSGVGHSLNEIVGLVREVTGVDVEVRHEQARVFDVPAIVLDVARFSALTGWAPRVDLRSGMALMWQHLTHP